MKHYLQPFIRWCIAALLIPLLISCAAITPLLMEFSVYIGQSLAFTLVGSVTELVIDNVFDKLSSYFHSDVAVGSVIRDRGDSLQGTYSTWLAVTARDSLNSKECKIYQPRMHRDSVDSPWQLNNDVKQLVLDCLNQKPN